MSDYFPRSRSLAGLYDHHDVFHRLSIVSFLPSGKNHRKRIEEKEARYRLACNRLALFLTGGEDDEIQFRPWPWRVVRARRISLETTVSSFGCRRGGNET